jgi:hypothetical protein
LTFICTSPSNDKTKVSHFHDQTWKKVRDNHHYISNFGHEMSWVRGRETLEREPFVFLSRNELQSSNENRYWSLCWERENVGKSRVKVPMLLHSLPKEKVCHHESAWEVRFGWPCSFFSTSSLCFVRDFEEKGK